MTAIVDLLASLSDSDRDPAVQIEAVETLGELPDQAGRDPPEVLAQTHAKPEVRREAIETLVEHAKAVRGDRPVARDCPEGQGRGRAARGGRSAWPRSTTRRRATTLGELARTHPDEHIRAEAVESLGDVGAGRTKRGSVEGHRAERHGRTRSRRGPRNARQSCPTAPGPRRSSSWRARTGTSRVARKPSSRWAMRSRPLRVRMC